ncbi:trypsin alpha-3-like [Daphnia carinata]|uniref:trypsin alpha-3-like n=1 Tax=Daphnia carinata TaxID=120202 RepID=UPI00286902B9|nr:trypsin alpha-3-like [Daphnia carinata]
MVVYYSFIPSDASGFIVHLNTLLIDGEAADAITRGVASFVMHENYERRQKSQAIRAFPDYANTAAVIAEWGTNSSGGNLSKVLLKADVTVLENTLCASQYAVFNGANMLCAAGSDTATCQGDSDGVEVGIASLAKGCADTDYAGVYTRVSTYIGWIADAQSNNPGRKFYG